MGEAAPVPVEKPSTRPRSGTAAQGFAGLCYLRIFQEQVFPSAALQCHCSCFVLGPSQVLGWAASWSELLRGAKMF